MKNLLFTLVFFCTIASVTYAQSPLVISRGNFNVTPSVDTLINIGNLDGIANPIEGANKTWDYSKLDVSIKTIQTLNCKKPIEPFFNTSTCWFPDNFDVLAKDRGYYYDDFSTLSDNNYSFVGIRVNEQRFGIGNITSNDLDSIIFPAQNFRYTNPRIAMKFPSTYNTVTKSELIKSIDFQLSLGVVSFDHTPCKKITNITQIDSVVGWGTLIVPNIYSPNGKSQPYNVLLMKRYYTTIDSMYLNGAPAPKLLLDNFGLQQGFTQNFQSYIFWRENKKLPLLTLNYGDTKFALIQSVDFDFSTDVSTSVDDFNNETITSIVFPNPASGNVSIEIPQINEFNLLIIISDLNGNIVLEQNLFNSNIENKYTIKLPDNIIDGYYIFKISNASGKIISKGKFLVSK
jgi:hypothetical protein